MSVFLYTCASHFRGTRMSWKIINILASIPPLFNGLLIFYVEMASRKEGQRSSKEFLAEADAQRTKTNTHQGLRANSWDGEVSFYQKSEHSLLFQMILLPCSLSHICIWGKSADTLYSTFCAIQELTTGNLVTFSVWVIYCAWEPFMLWR